MSGPLNIQDYVTRRVYYAVKEHLQPQLDRLAAYEKLAKEGSNVRICQGCTFPYAHGTITERDYVCYQCTTILNCNRPECKPYFVSCPLCRNRLCNRHIDQMRVTICCKKSICGQCFYPCKLCKGNMCYDCTKMENNGLVCDKCANN